MKDKQRKKVQREVNRDVRAMNHNIATDTLWRGRFTAHQVKASWYRFEDGSGGELSILLELRDKKTNQKKTVWANNYNVAWTLWKEMNNFIVEDCHNTTWGDREALYNDKTDYTKVV